MSDKLRIGSYYVSAWSARLILLALVVLTPWLYGGQFWQIQVGLLYSGVALTGFTWLATCMSPRRTGSCPQLSYVMLGFMLLVGVQMVTLPGWLAPYLSSAQRFLHEVNLDNPGREELASSAAKLTIWQDASRHRTLSILPVQTQASLAVFALAVVAVWSASVLFVSKRWATALAVTLAISGLLNAFLGLAQAVSWNEWTLLPGLQKISFSTFISRNSAPDYFATGTGAMLSLLGIAFRNQKHKRHRHYQMNYASENWQARLRNRMEDVFVDLNTLAVTCILGIAFMLVATLATLSRGGVVACLGASVVTLCFAMGGRGGIARTTTISIVLLAMVFGVLTFFGLDAAVMSRMDELNEAAYTGGDGRFTVWKYTLAAIQWYWLGGSGLGTYHFAILPFHTAGPDAWFYHAENLWLEIASETGLAGLAIAMLALWLVARKIVRQDAGRKENLLLIAAAFSTCAIFLHSLVDFRLIMPGVFLPYAVLIGAFMGRSRRIENERAYRELTSEKHAHDARIMAATLRSERMRSRFIGHGIVAAASLLCMGLGLNSARSFAAAERLKNDLDYVEDQLTRGDEVDWESLAQSLEETVAHHSGHPEVQLQSGRVEQLLWHQHAYESIDWGDGTSSLEKWKGSTPQVLTSVMRSPMKEVAPLQLAISQDTHGMALARSSFARFEAALAACPLDERAVWGVLTSDAHWLSAEARSALRRMLSRLAGNNSRILMKESIAAILEGDKAQGLPLLQQAVALNRERLFDALPPLAGFIEPEELMEIAPSDPVFLAGLCRELVMKGGAALADQVIAMKLEPAQLEAVEQATPEGWSNLAWVAQRLKEPELRVALLAKAVAIARDRHALRFELAQAEYDAGMFDRAMDDLEYCIKAAPNQPLYSTELAKWTQSLDQKR